VDFKESSRKYHEFLRYIKDIGDPTKDYNNLLKRQILMLAFEHMTDVYERIDTASRKRFQNFDASYPRMVVAVNMRRYFGIEQKFWDLIFETEKPTLNVYHPDIEDDKVWDIIIPIGYKVIQFLRRTLITNFEVEAKWYIPDLLKPE